MSEASDALGLGRPNFGQSHVFMVRTKPSKQPLRPVTCGVPIEKVWPKATQHSDWACGAAGTPKGCLGRSNFGQGHVFMVRDFENFLRVYPYEFFYMKFLFFYPSDTYLYIHITKRKKNHFGQFLPCRIGRSHMAIWECCKFITE